MDVRRRKTLWLSALVIGALLGWALLGAAQLSPGEHHYQLVRKTLENVDDVAGRWQHAAGEVYQRGKLVGYYVSIKRVTWGGSDPLNTAALTMTIFWIGAKPPENFTLQGSHDFSSGNQIGSVSAASSLFTSYIGKSFLREGDTLIIYN